jgi:hypothetical protein
MPTIQLEHLTPFGRLAVKLDADFAELIRLSGQIQKADLQSDSGLTHAAKQVEERAMAIQERKQQQAEIQERLLQIELNVKAANSSLAHFKNAGQNQIRTELERINIELKKFLADVQAIKEEAAKANFKGIEREAQSVIETLRTSSRKVDKATS